MNTPPVEKYGPLSWLAGRWEGDKGSDVAPSSDRGTKTSRYRELMVFEPFGPTDNHEQHLYGLRYALTAWRVGEPDPFHEDRGYLLYDPDRKHIMRAFAIPRGMAALAGGTAEAQAKEFNLTAVAGDPVYGICSNPFLDEEFKTVRFEMSFKLNADGTATYRQDSQLAVKGQKAIFHHVDSNTLKRV